MATVADLLVRIRGDSSQLQRELGKTSALTRSFGTSTALTFAKVGVGAVGVAGLVGGIFTTKAIRSAIDFESAFAGVKKTVEATPAEFARLREELLNLSEKVPASANALASIAENAGQLGIHKDAIIGFTRVIADLGATTNLAGEQGATMLAQFANITQMAQTDFDRLGSTIVALGNAGASTESQIADMAMRIAGSGHLVGMSEAEILGLAESMASLGLEAEMGGTAVSRTISEMAKAVGKGGDDLKRWAIIAGTSTEEFARLFKERPVDALQAFIDGLARMGGEGIELYSVLERVGLGGVRVTDTLLRAAGAGDHVHESIRNANKAWSENNALTEEARKRYETTAAKIQMLRNRFEHFAIGVGTQMLPLVNKALDGISQWFDDHGEQMINGWKGAWERLNPILSNTWDTLTSIYDVADKIVTSSPFQMVLDITVQGIDLLMQALDVATSLPGNVSKAKALFGELKTFVGRELESAVGKGGGGSGWVGVIKDTLSGDIGSAYKKAEQGRAEMNRAVNNVMGRSDPIVGGELPFEEWSARAYESASALNEAAAAVTEVGNAAAGAKTDMGAFNDYFGDDAGAKIEERARQTEELARAWIEGGAEMAAAVQAFHDRANALWPSVVAEAAAAGVQLVEDDRASWEVRLNNGENIVDQLIRLQEERAAREKALANDVKDAWIAGGAEMAARVRAHQIELASQWEEAVARARDAGIELTEADRETWERRVENGERYIDRLIRLEQELADARKRAHEETVEAFDRGGSQLVASVVRLHAELDQRWAEFVARARAAGIEVVDADRAAWEARVLNGQSAVDYLIKLEEELAAARKRAAEQARSDAIAAVDQLGGLLETALQRKYAAEERAATAAVQRQIDAADAAARAQLDAIETARDAALRSLDDQVTAAKAASESMIKSLVAPLQAQLDALDELDRQDSLQAIADQLKITYDPREEKQLLDQRKEIERGALRDRLRDQIQTIEETARSQQEIVERSMSAQRDAINARYDAERDAAEAAAEATADRLQAQLDDVREKYAAMSDSFAIQSEVRRMLMNGEVDKMAALLDQFVPEWRTAGLSYGQMLIDGIRASGVEEYIASVLAQVSAANAAAAAVSASPSATAAPTAADKLADQMSIKALVDGGAPQAAIDAQRASYQQIYGEPSPYRRGGVFTSAHVGVMGEYPGATTNPEITTPQDILRETFRGVLEEFGGSFGGPVTVEVYIGGERIEEVADARIRHHQRASSREAVQYGVGGRGSSWRS